MCLLFFFHLCSSPQRANVTAQRGTALTQAFPMMLSADRRVGATYSLTFPYTSGRNERIRPGTTGFLLTRAKDSSVCRNTAEALTRCCPKRSVDMFDCEDTETQQEVNNARANTELKISTIPERTDRPYKGRRPRPPFPPKAAPHSLHAGVWTRLLQTTRTSELTLSS